MSIIKIVSFGFSKTYFILFCNDLCQFSSWSISTWMMIGSWSFTLLFVWLSVTSSQGLLTRMARSILSLTCNLRGGFDTWTHFPLCTRHHGSVLSWHDTCPGKTFLLSTISGEYCLFTKTLDPSIFSAEWARMNFLVIPEICQNVSWMFTKNAQTSPQRN